MALKNQGFQLSHIRQLLESHADHDGTGNLTLMRQLQQQYQTVVQQLTRLRQTATALEGLLGRDQDCQITHAAALSHLKQLQAEAQTGLSQLDPLWIDLDAEIATHPEAFQESLQRLLPDLSGYSEITVHLLQQLVLACGDVSLVNFLRLSGDAVAAARAALKASCTIVTDLPTVAAALDQTRLAHLGCAIEVLIENLHVTGAKEAEHAFWEQASWQQRLQQLPQGSILVIGYAPSVLVTTCQLIEQQIIQPALIIGLPLGFSHAPAAKRRLMQMSIPSITIESSLGGGLLAAVTLNALLETLLEKPNCHCYLTRP
jgi:precorrin-8X/cobalt-precorrin-8 methylmutase